MLDEALKVNRFMLKYCRELMADLPEERLAEQPVAGVNHPAWILGHLAFAADRAATLLGAAKQSSDEATAMYGPGSKLTANRADYPTKDELVKMVDDSYARLHRTIAEAKAEAFAALSQNPRSKEILPTVGDAIAHLLTSHIAMHLGQLSMWRRMLGKPPLF